MTTEEHEMPKSFCGNLCVQVSLLFPLERLSNNFFFSERNYSELIKACVTCLKHQQRKKNKCNEDFLTPKKIVLSY